MRSTVIAVVASQVVACFGGSLATNRDRSYRCRWFIRLNIRAVTRFPRVFGYFQTDRQTDRRKDGRADGRTGGRAVGRRGRRAVGRAVMRVGRQASRHAGRQTYILFIT